MGQGLSGVRKVAISNDLAHNTGIWQVLGDDHMGTGGFLMNLKYLVLSTARPFIACSRKC
jgi:hypothetical protein